jgi:TetR/AcrR family transcriptional regulator, transcriptional repressor for nem operon
VADSERDRAGRRLTARGIATRARIVEAAAELMHVRGITATTMEDVRVASGTSKSQLYQHFPDKSALVSAVIAYQAGGVLERDERRLARLDSFRGLERWRDAILQNNALRQGAYGCPLGSLVAEVADDDEEARKLLAESFQRWESLLVQGFERMRSSGVLRADADPERLAIGVIGALQGGYLLAQAEHDTAPMAVVFDMAIDHVKSFAASSGPDHG